MEVDLEGLDCLQKWCVKRSEEMRGHKTQEHNGLFIIPPFLSWYRMLIQPLPLMPNLECVPLLRAAHRMMFCTRMTHRHYQVLVVVAKPYSNIVTLNLSRCEPPEPQGTPDKKFQYGKREEDSAGRGRVQYRVATMESTWSHANHRVPDSPYCPPTRNLQSQQNLDPATHRQPRAQGPRTDLSGFPWNACPLPSEAALWGLGKALMWGNIGHLTVALDGEPWRKILIISRLYRAVDQQLVQAVIGDSAA